MTRKKKKYRVGRFLLQKSGIFTQSQEYFIISKVIAAILLHQVAFEMRFGENLGQSIIPEWKDCYLNYESLKLFISLIEVIVDILNKYELPVIDSSKTINTNSQTNLLSGEEIDLNKIKIDFLKQISEINSDFFQLFQRECNIFELFYQMKVLQIEGRSKAIEWMKNQNYNEEQRQLFLLYIQYSYIQLSYLSEMRETNIQAQRKILKKHRKYAKNFINTPDLEMNKVNRMIYIEEKYYSFIQETYVKISKHQDAKEARLFLRRATHKNTNETSQYIWLGVGVGASCAIIITFVVIIVFDQLTVKGDTLFQRDFPTWRGIAIIIIYIWILGFNLYCFQTYKISHRLIFKFYDHHYSTSADLFKLAGFFTVIFLICFFFYILNIHSLISINSIIRLQYLALIPYMLLLIYLFTPFQIFNYNGRLYVLKLILKCVIAVIIGVEFPVAWTSSQWISLVTHFRDIAYTVCYYSKLNFDDPSNNPCSISQTFEVAMLAIVIAYTFRLLQVFRLGYDEGFFFTKHFFKSISMISSLVSSILAYLYSTYPNLLIYWIVLSVLSTLYSYYVDLKYDWGLLESSSRYCLLRNYLIFDSKSIYYIIIAFNLVLRLAWMITLSPAMVHFFEDINVATLVTASAEIIRKGIWNILRVQNQHLRNCVEFRAIPDLKEFQERLGYAKVKDEEQIDIRNIAHSRHREIMRKQFSELIKKMIKERQEKEANINREYEQQHRQRIKISLQRLKGFNGVKKERQICQIDKNM